jgi:hypothetical protein
MSGSLAHLARRALRGRFPGTVLEVFALGLVFAFFVDNFPFDVVCFRTFAFDFAAGTLLAEGFRADVFFAGDKRSFTVAPAASASVSFPSSNFSACGRPAATAFDATLLKTPRLVFIS